MTSLPADSVRRLRIRSDVPAVVVGGALNSLGVVRSLSHGNMPIYLLDTSRRGVAAWSRFSNFVRIPSLEGRDLIDSLVTLGARLPNRPVLILTGDQSVDAVSDHREEVESLYRIALPSADMVRALADKTLFQALAEREGFPVPRSVVISGPADLNLLEQLLPPLIMKPADKTLVLNGVVARAERAATLPEALTAATGMLENAPKLIAQEWIEGPDTEIYFALFSCNRQGDVIGLFTGRKIVCSPPNIGSTAVCVEASEAADALRPSVMEFIARVGYCGLGSLEFKRDSRERGGSSSWSRRWAGRTGRRRLQRCAALTCPDDIFGCARSTPAPIDKPTRPVAWRSSFGMDRRRRYATGYPCSRWPFQVVGPLASNLLLRNREAPTRPLAPRSAPFVH